MEWLSMGQWSPYVVGIGIGLLSCLSFLVSDKALGCSTAFSRTSGMIERLFRGGTVAEKAYYKKFTPSIDWEWLLVAGIFVGAFLSAQWSGQFRWSWVPDLWAGSFGDASLVRWVVSLGGGIIMGIGARWAGGCTSGHGISGTLQLAVSSWLATLSFFVGGIITAMILYGGL
ncbi:MAG: YeeE/YedE family protein [Deltaproteobacteria bacterium]|nr:YeeE/YedE family protein [Deltaproteobacteria bacterium]